MRQKILTRGLRVLFVSRQLGHASPATTLFTCVHLFERVDHAAAREALEASYAAMVSTSGRCAGSFTVTTTVTTCLDAPGKEEPRRGHPPGSVRY